MGLGGYVVYRDGQNCGGTYGAWDRRACEFHMRRHAVQYAYTPGSDPALALAFLHRDDSEGRSEAERWIRMNVEHEAARNVQPSPV